MIADDFLAGLIGALVGLALQAAYLAVRAAREFRNTEFGGTIYAVLAPSGGKGERRERMRLRQRGQCLRGTIERKSPPAEAGKKWHLVGYVHGNVVTAVFYPKAARRDPTSYGIIALNRDPSTPQATWKGYYIRPDLSAPSTVHHGTSDPHPLTWHRDPGVL